MRYNAIYKPNQLILGNLESCTVIVTGWTLKEVVAKQVSPEHYAAIGQLYNPVRGINYLVRNLLANPHIRWLVSLGITREDVNAGAVKCLNDFFTHGVTEGVSDTGRDCWVINSEVKGYIDLDIPLYDLEVLRLRVTHQPSKGIKDTALIANTLHESRFSGNYDRPPKMYPMTLPRSDTRPASPYGHRISGETIADCWLAILHHIRLNGTLSNTSYDGCIQELIDLVVVVEHEPESLYFPEPNYLPIDRAFMEGGYLDAVLEDSEPQEGIKYAYGHRMRSWFDTDQVADVVAKLKANPNSTQALIDLWDAKVDNLEGSSPPCLITVWLRIVETSLTLTAHLRSNDMFSAWPANAMALRVLQTRIRDQVNPDLDIGPLVTVSGSAHIYDDTFEAADRTIKSHYKHHKVQYGDKVGYFMVEPSEGAVTVTQMHPNGEKVTEFRGTKPLKLLRDIVHQNPTIQADHAAYLGLEVSRAFDKGLEYQQDKG